MFFRRGLFSLAAAVLCAVPVLAAWQPVNPADLALKQSKLDANADAEALFREVHISNEQHGATYAQNVVSEYVRLKIFTARGKELGNVQLPYYGKEHIYDVQGRTIHADGSIVELGKDAIFSRVLEKRGYKTKVITFAMPAVEPGSIIEYRFTKNEGERTNRYQPLEVQSEYPVDELTFFLKPLSNIYVSYPAMRYLPFGCNPERGDVTRDGFDVLKIKNVPAFHQEPFSPPKYSSKQWILVYYEENSKSGKDQYWTSLGKDLYNEYGHQIKVNGELKAIATEVMAGAVTDDEKLTKLLNYCRTELKDTSRDEIATASRDEAKINKNTLDTIHRKQGTTVDINYAFLALAQAAGFDARRADLSDRSTLLFGPAMQSRYFLNSFDIAVNVGGKWQFYDVTNPAVPGGQLRWQEQGVYALVTDGKHPEMVQTPMLGAAENMERRIANLSLSEEGTLEGDIREMKFGNYASEWREHNRYTNDAQREQELRDELKERFADFSLTKVGFTASPDASKPVGVVYHIVIPNYTQRSGKRLFVRPDYFASGYGSLFTESTRYNNIYFEFPWSEFDTIEMKVPTGFVLDHADAPTGIKAPPTCVYTVQIRVDQANNALQYERRLVFGGKDLLMFDKQVYPTLKKVFDTVHESDNHILTLKAADIAATAQ
jgi:hypothetical protein